MDYKVKLDLCEFYFSYFKQKGMNQIREKEIYLVFVGVIIIILLIIVIFLVRGYQKGSFISDEDLLKATLESSKMSQSFADRLKNRTSNLQLREMIDRFLTADKQTTQELETYLSSLDKNLMK